MLRHLDSSRVKEFLTRFVTAVCLLVTIFHLADQLPKAMQPGGTGRDLAVYYTAAQKARRRETPYTPVAQHALDEEKGTYLYPPPFAAAISPLGALPEPAFYRAWYLLLEL